MEVRAVGYNFERVPIRTITSQFGLEFLEDFREDFYFLSNQPNRPPPKKKKKFTMFQQNL
jgi:hypothetical protein